MTDAHLNPAAQALRALSVKDFMAFGLHHIAYIRPAEGQAGFALHAADGSLLSVQNNAAQAVLAARQNNLAAMSVH